jgi:hypothetical protein
MGLADRDYMRERHRRQQTATGTIQLPGSNSLWDILKKSLVIVGAAAALWWLALHYKEARHAEAFPPTGAVMWFVETPEPGASAALTIAAPADRNVNFAVKLSDWGSGRAVAVIPVRAGETAAVQVPLGEYRITMASGINWQGADAMFGRTGETREAVDPMRFYKTDLQTMGHRIDLAARLNGNLRTRAIGTF